MGEIPKISSLNALNKWRTYANQICLSPNHALTQQSGEWTHPIRGTGLDLRELRTYEEGDNVRHISWSVTARVGSPILKVFQSELTFPLFGLMDVSGSSLDGSPTRKSTVYAELFGVLGLAALRQGGTVGGGFFDNDLRNVVKFSRTPSSLLHLLRCYETLSPLQRKSDFHSTSLKLRTLLRTPTFVIVFSDFVFQLPEMEMAKLSRKHDLLLVHVKDSSLEKDGPPWMIRRKDPETGRTVLTYGRSRRDRRALKQFAQEIEKKIGILARHVGAHYFVCDIHENYLSKLVDFCNSRHFAS